jgi:GTPase SAR1 family protein
VCLLCLCGLPGAGKSTLTAQLLDHKQGTQALSYSEWTLSKGWDMSYVIELCFHARTGPMNAQFTSMWCHLTASCQQQEAAKPTQRSSDQKHGR